jgi:hypothetical protein
LSGSASASGTQGWSDIASAAKQFVVTPSEPEDAVHQRGGVGIRNATSPRIVDVARMNTADLVQPPLSVGVSGTKTHPALVVAVISILTL